MDPDSLQ